MQTNTATPWMPRLAAFGVALLLAGSVVFWVLRWPVADAGPPLPLPLASEDTPPVGAGVVARLLGAVTTPAEAAAAPEASSRFKLTGIVALGSGTGVALLSIDGKPAKPFRVGNAVEAGWVLQSVEARAVALGTQATGPVGLKLELPPRQP